jgi:hypothetical protein
VADKLSTPADKPSVVAANPPTPTDEQLKAMALGILSHYRTSTFPMEKFDQAFKTIETIADNLESCFIQLKRAQLHVARRLKFAIRTLNASNAYAPYISERGHSLVSTLDMLVTEYRQSMMPRKIPLVADLLSDLKSISKEFPLLKLDHDVLTVNTDPIELAFDGYVCPLGPFSIMVDLEAVAIGATEAFDVTALEPHWNQDKSFTHPHITGTSLCTGDGTTSVKRALFDGRYYDFFIIVNAVLTNYNDRSPYAKLATWKCTVPVPNSASENEDQDADDSNPDEVDVCALCNNSIEPDTGGTCDHCSGRTCDDCLVHCEASGQWLCQHCLDDLHCDCEHYGVDGCSAFQNHPCIECNNILAVVGTHDCSHANAVDRYGTTRHRVICDDCGGKLRDDNCACTIRSYNADGNPVSLPCTAFGSENCTLVAYFGMEEHEPEPQPTPVASEPATHEGETHAG